MNLLFNLLILLSLIAPKTIEYHPSPHSLPPSCNSSLSPTLPGLPNVGYCCVLLSIGCGLRPWWILSDLFFVASFAAPNNGTTPPPPRTPPPPLHATSTTSSLLLQSAGLLLCISINFWPCKANSPTISLIFDGSLYSIPNRGTNRVEQRWTPCVGALAAAPPWFGGTAGLRVEREGKATGGEGSGGPSCCVLSVVSCVLCAVCCVLCRFFWFLLVLIVE